MTNSLEFPLEANPEFILKIEKIVHGGAGLAYHNEKTYFVEGVCVGEKVTVTNVTQKGQSCFAQVDRIIEFSEHRQQPFCNVFGKCGGCNWQHIQHKAQVQYKQQIFSDCLQRLGKIKLSIDIECVSGQDRYYRHRAQFKAVDGKLGFYAHKSKQVIEFDECPILVDELNKFVKAIKSNQVCLPSSVENLRAIAGSDGNVASDPVLEGLSTKNSDINLDSFKFSVSGASFFQQNRELTGALGRWVGKHVSGQLCYDLFGGSGFFSLMVHRSFDKVILVERSKELVNLAILSFKNNGVGNVEAKAMSAESFFISPLVKKQPTPCTVIVDPPRGGLSPEVRQGILGMNIEQLVYVACDPATQARDVGELMQSGVFEISQIALFDLYPNTHHMETVMVLKRII